jgi:hypothetical protein
MFCPFVPRNIVPQGLLGKANGFFGGLKKHPDYGEKDGEERAKRGNGLRDFVKFLEEHDAESSFAGLRRVCCRVRTESETDRTIWGRNESASKMEENEDGGVLEDENGRMRKELRDFKEASLRC